MIHVLALKRNPYYSIDNVAETDLPDHFYRQHPTTSPPIVTTNLLANDLIRSAEYDANREAQDFTHMEVPEEPCMIPLPNMEVPKEPYTVPLPNNISKQSSIDSPETPSENGGLSKQKMWAILLKWNF